MNSIYKYVVFSPYFGKLPNWFDLWLKACSYNGEFRFIVFTDDMSLYDVPNNVEIIQIPFEDFKCRIQKRFDFKIALNSPYKLCDFKPAWGYVFPEYIKNCSYWGYCDIDLIFGDIGRFLPKKDYDKISYLGHFCLYRNDRKINEAFMNGPRNTIGYSDILSHDQHFGFDEIGDYGINNIFKLNDFSIYNFSSDTADIDCKKRGFFRVGYDGKKFVREKEEELFVFDEGKVFSINLNNDGTGKKYAYVHFQKRKMHNNVKNKNRFIIDRDGFVDYIPSKSNYALSVRNSRVDFRWLKFDLMAMWKRAKRMMVIKKIQRKGA